MPTASASRWREHRGRRLARAVTLLPAGLCALAAALGGRDDAARRWLGVGAAPGHPRPRTAQLVGHAALTVLLGVLALIPAGVLLLAVLRGPFYGLVDDGPYDGSWGGPGRTGAWLAHFAAALPLAAAAAGLLYGLAHLHRLLTAPLRGERRPRWVVLCVPVCVLAGALFVTAFVRQLS